VVWWGGLLEYVVRLGCPLRIPEPCLGSDPESPESAGMIRSLFDPSSDHFLGFFGRVGVMTGAFDFCVRKYVGAVP